MGMIKVDHIEKKVILKTFLHTGYKGSMPVVFYRRPGKRTVSAILGSSSENNFSFRFQKSSPGFLFSPFENFTNSGSVFIRSGIRYDEGEGRLFQDDPGTDDIYSQLQGDLQENQQENQDFVPSFYKSCIKTPPKGELGKYGSVVGKALKHIRSGDFDKVVLAARKEISLPAAFDIVEMFLSMAGEYKNAFVSMVSLPGIGTWTGSSPELLVTLNKNTLKTVALAGTKRYRSNGSEEKWTNKEYTEQEFVTCYIEDAFQQSGLENYTVSPPQTAVAGNIMHLSSGFTASVNKNDLPKCAELLNRIHPTPAICGIPVKPAYEFITRHEKFSREFYAGYLGPVNIENPVELFVNLRCMKIVGGSTVLYSGAGITSDSVPGKESEEIQLKFRTIENVLNRIITGKEVTH